MSHTDSLSGHSLLLIVYTCMGSVRLVHVYFWPHIGHCIRYQVYIYQVTADTTYFGFVFFKGWTSSMFRKIELSESAAAQTAL